MPPPPLRVINLGRRLVPYALASDLQDGLEALRRAGSGVDTVVVLQVRFWFFGFGGRGVGWSANQKINPSNPSPQHEPVVTLGKRGTRDDVRSPAVPVVVSPRGGQATYHGPGQAVVYPILSLRAWKLGARAYVEALEDAAVRVAAARGVAAEAGRVAPRTGVWVAGRKLAAVGVRVSGGVTSHGIAFNVTTDVAAFRAAVVPCGDADTAPTTLAAELAPGSPPPDAVTIGDELAAELAAGLGGRAVPASVEEGVAGLAPGLRAALAPWC